MSLESQLTELFNNEHSVAEAFMRCDFCGFADYDVKEDCGLHSCSDELFEYMQKVQIDCMESYGGEDMGSKYWSVHKFTLGDEVEYIKFDGYYASSYGSEYQGYRFVKPVEKTVIVYE